MMFLALKHLTSRKKQTIVTLLGIVIGTTSFIVISCFFRGVQDYLTDSMVSGDAHIKVMARERLIKKDEIEKILFPDYTHFNWLRKPAGRRSSVGIDNTFGWIQKFEKSPDVLAATMVYSTTALINYNQTIYSISITGMDPSDQVKVTNIEKKMVSGSLLQLNKGTGRIVIGHELSETLAKIVGDKITLTANDGRRLPFIIVGIFNTGNKNSDLNSTYMKISDARKLGNAPGKTSQISVKVKNFRQAAAIASIWKISSFDKVESWDQANENLMSMFRSQDFTRYMATGIIMIVAAFGIYNILNMVVNQKRKDIAILRSMGYESKDVIQLFLLQGVILGVLGGILGCLIGYLIGAAIGTVSFGPPGQGSGDGFTLDFNFSIYLSAVLISNGVAIAASFFPARAASKLSPIEIIRGGE